ncbi:protein starmaker-like isoform X1 [Biomphalaria pfeifferi]|uniref:Protein starmaker-like isoform X1 n=1 Tax=Biomphalaria pfeifferi TaxID=112525 RepID=A0AAD8BUI5_BIOPF|nr:protein starmaker-like isoform X1 [Biomphalaria pfeifferi]
MTLERSISQTTFNTNNQITTTILAERLHRTSFCSPTAASPCHVPLRVSTPRAHPPLNKTNSDHAILALKSNLDYAKPGWSPTGSVDDVQLRKKEYRAVSKPQNARRQLSLQGSNLSPQAYLQKIPRRSSFPHVYRQDSRRVSNSSSFVESNSQIKENNTLNSSSITQFTEKSSRASLEKSNSSQESAKGGSKEFLLEFPPMPKSGTSLLSAAKKSEKSKEKKCNLKPAQSMPGLVEASSKDCRAYSADARPRQSTSCAFFMIFKRKKRSKEDRSPSPVRQYSYKSTESAPKSELHTTSNKDNSILESSDPKERRTSHSSKERRISQTSSHKDRPPSQASSSRYQPTPSSSLSVLSPSTTDRTPKFESRSRLRHRKDKNTHRHTSGSRSQSDSRKHSKHHHIRHEDLPPHPSILKQSKESTNIVTSLWSKSKSKSETKSRDQSKEVDNRKRVQNNNSSHGDTTLQTKQKSQSEHNSKSENKRDSEDRDARRAHYKKVKGKQDNNNRPEDNKVVDIVIKPKPSIAENIDSTSQDDIILAGNLSLPLDHINKSRHSSCVDQPIIKPESDSDSDCDQKPGDDHFEVFTKTSASQPSSHKKVQSPSCSNTSSSNSDSPKKTDNHHSQSSPKKANVSSSESSPIVKSTESACGSTPNLRGKSLISTSKTEPAAECHEQPAFDRHPVRSRSLPRFEPHLQFDADNKVISDTEDFEYRPTEMKGPLHLSFCGCGFLGMYHLGVVTCLVNRAPAFLEKIEKVSGASAGALMAAVLVTARDKTEEASDHVQNLAKEIRKKTLGALTPGYSFTRSLRYMLDDLLPENAHVIAQGKLYISLTNAQTKKNELISDYKSRDELIDALIASCYIPVYAGMKAPTIGGKKYIDGGLTDNMPRFESGRTITVSPFDGKSDIGPKTGQELEKKAHFINFQNQDYQVEVNMNNFKKGKDAFFPPKSHILQEYFEKGRFDASRFLIREGLYQINTQQQQERVLYESSV